MGHLMGTDLAVAFRELGDLAPFGLGERVSRPAPASRRLLPAPPSPPSLPEAPAGRAAFIAVPWRHAASPPPSGKSTLRT